MEDQYFTYISTLQVYIDMPDKIPYFQEKCSEIGRTESIGY